MKNLTKKQTLALGLGIIAVCLIVVVIGMFVNRSTSREATALELETYAPYSVDWTSQDDSGAKSDKEIILALCESAGEKEVGSSTYPSYTSGSIGSYLYHFSEILEIYTMDEVLYVSYKDTDDRTVILAYNDTGLCERGIYNPADDTFFHELDGVVTVWEKFAGGIQWG